MPNGATYSSAKYNYTSYINEALRIINIWFVNNATKMNPNVRYGQMTPNAPAFGKSSQMYFDTGAEGAGIGIEDLSSQVVYLIESIKLLE